MTKPELLRRWETTGMSYNSYVLAYHAMVLNKTYDKVGKEFDCSKQHVGAVVRKLKAVE